MNDYYFKNLSTVELQKLIQEERESDYLVIDVRTPQEYGVYHIPGAKLIPLSEIEARLFDLPSDRKLIFYCRSGNRSKAAVLLAAEAQINNKGIYNLEGGMLGWKGYALSDLPRVEIFKDFEDPVKILMVAINLEKGAYLFYKYIQDNFSSIEVYDTVCQLAKAETAHAKAVYGLLQKIDPAVENFETLYENLPGDILEGGKKLETQLQQFMETDKSTCIRFIEVALEIEYAAYDLYRTIAEKTIDQNTRDSLLKIAQMEKAHMRALTKASGKCMT